MEEIRTQAQNAENGTQPVTGERTFTQEEVNRIVSDRLAREKAKVEAVDPLREREKAVAIRESVAACKELVGDGQRIPKKLLDILDTSDYAKFKETAEAIIDAFPGVSPVYTMLSGAGAPSGWAPKTSYVDNDKEALKRAFGLNT